MMRFSTAVDALMRGEKVRRFGWIRKNMHVYTLGACPPLIDRHDVVLHESLEPCMVLRTADDKHQPGWAPSQADMFAEDWEIVSVGHA